MLVSDLDEGVDEDVEEAWLEEAQRRHEQLKSGAVQAVSGHLVFQRARERLKG